MQSSSFSVTANDSSFKLMFKKFTEKQFEGLVEIHNFSGHHLTMFLRPISGNE
jgi:hypothetical protein